MAGSQVLFWFELTTQEALRLSRQILRVQINVRAWIFPTKPHLPTSIFTLEPDQHRAGTQVRQRRDEWLGDRLLSTTSCAATLVLVDAVSLHVEDDVRVAVAECNVLCKLIKESSRDDDDVPRLMVAL